MKLLRGRNAIITGARTGLGFEIASHFVAAGASVAICSRDEAALSRASKTLSQRASEGQKAKMYFLWSLMYLNLPLLKNFLIL